MRPVMFRHINSVGVPDKVREVHGALSRHYYLKDYVRDYDIERRSNGLLWEFHMGHKIDSRPDPLRQFNPSFSPISKIGYRPRSGILWAHWSVYGKRKYPGVKELLDDIGLHVLAYGPNMSLQDIERPE